MSKSKKKKKNRAIRLMFHLILNQHAWQKVFGNRKLFCTHNGIRYRVTGASRLSDIYLTQDFESCGYEQRGVDVDECSDWSETP